MHGCVADEVGTLGFAVVGVGRIVVVVAIVWFTGCGEMRRWERDGEFGQEVAESRLCGDGLFVGL